MGFHVLTNETLDSNARMPPQLISYIKFTKKTVIMAK